MSEAPSILVLGYGHPWVVGEGTPLRGVGILRALTQIGRVTYVGIGPDASPAPAVPPDLFLVQSLGINEVPTATEATWRRQLRRLSRAMGLPIGRSGRLQLGGRLSDHIDLGQFDVVWYVSAGIYESMRGALKDLPVAHLVDLNDWPGEWPGGPRFRPRDLLTADRQRALRALRLQRGVHLEDRRARRIARRADGVVVSKAPEEPPANLTVVVNSYRSRPFTGVRPVSAQPTLLFQGTFGYGPNIEAARHLVHDVLPPLREELPEGFSIRLVGKHEHNIRQLEEEPEVTVTGYVDDIARELLRADLCVVPLLHGTGTRLKILEAWSFQVPVVSTTVGADGLGARDETHLLVADDPAAFARACRRALTDARLRERLVAEGHQLLNVSFEVNAVTRQVRDALRVAAANRAAANR